MNKKVSKALVATLVLGTMVPATFASAASFTDINNSYAKDAITRLAELGVINGKDDTHFDPQGAVTRAEFVKILVRSLNLPTTATSSSFSDVSGWATSYIETAYNAGLVNGVGNGLFDPNSIVTREQAAVMLVKALQHVQTLDSTGTATFGDMNQVSDWAQGFIGLAQKYNLIKGDGTNFNPKQNATREQAVILTENILRAIDQLKKEYKITPENVTMNVGESKEFKVNGGGTYNTVAWSVSGNGTIDQNGKFTATSAGTATISALIDGAKTATTSVTVNAVPVTGGGGGGGGGSQEPPVANPETLLLNPALTIYAPNVDQEWAGYDANTVFQVNVNFASGTTSDYFTTAEVSLFNGDTKLATNTAKKDLLDSKSVGLTDLFGIGDQANTTDDSNWNIGAYPSNTPPTKVKFTLKDKNGVLHIVEAPITTVQKPAAPDVTVDDVGNMIVGLSDTMEYKIDDKEYVKYEGDQLPELDGTHTVLVRYAATGSTPHGLDKTLTFTDVTANDAAEFEAALSDPDVKTIGLPSGNIAGTFDISRDVTIIGQGDNTVIHAADTAQVNALVATSSHSPIFKVSNNANVTIKNLVIDGEGKGPDHPDFMGISFEDASGELENVKVLNIRDGETINGLQEGIAIYAENTDGKPRTVTVTGSRLSGYQKGGMVFKGEGLTVNVTGNEVTGAGETNIIAQNGIQLSGGATGTISSNHITGHKCTTEGWVGSATGILVWGAGEGYVVEGNTFEGNDTNVYEDISPKLQAPTLAIESNENGAITGVTVGENEVITVTSNDPETVAVNGENPLELTAKKAGTVEIVVTIADKNDPLSIREGYLTVTVEPAADPGTTDPGTTDPGTTQNSTI